MKKITHNGIAIYFSLTAYFLWRHIEYVLRNTNKIRNVYKMYTIFFIEALNDWHFLRPPFAEWYECKLFVLIYRRTPVRWARNDKVPIINWAQWSTSLHKSCDTISLNNGHNGVYYCVRAHVRDRFLWSSWILVWVWVHVFPFSYYICLFSTIF